MSRSDTPSMAALRLLTETARGSRRDAAFALWLTLRVAEDLVGRGDLPERSARRRVVALEKRLSSLTLPAGFRRALGGVVTALRDDGPDQARPALAQLAGPAGDLLGAEVAGAIQRLARPVKLA